MKPAHGDGGVNQKPEGEPGAERTEKTRQGKGQQHPGGEESPPVDGKGKGREKKDGSGGGGGSQQHKGHFSLVGMRFRLPVQ